VIALVARRTARERRARILQIVGGALGLFLAGTVWAQSNVADAATAFGDLSPEQQQALLQQLTGTASDGSVPRRAGDNRAGTSTRDSAARSSASRAAGTEPEAESPLLQSGDTVLVDLAIRRAPTGSAPPATAAANTPPVLPPEIELTGSERADAEKLMAEVHQRNPYVLDPDGAVLLPGFRPVTLAGLSEPQAAELLGAHPALAKLQVKVTRLPLKRWGVAALRPFGYELFANASSTFAPVTDVPVPADYLVGPGDELDVQLYGAQNRSLRLVVSRDGRINLPQLGPVSVAGRRFSEVREEVERRVARQLVGVNASLSMGEVRAIQVFVMGEARAPGAYTISGLGTMTSALFASGGVTPIASLRTIQLMRQGTTVRRLDLYDLLLHGDTSNDVKLIPGDVIFIPTVGPQVSVYGEVRRPAIYELKGSETVSAVVGMSGGLSAEADPGAVTLARIDENHRRVMLNVDLANGTSAAQGSRNGDVLYVARLRPTLDSGVVLQGHVYRPGNFAWHDGLRLSEVLPAVDELKPDADQHYILIRRELPPDRRIAVLSADLAAALRAPGSAADLPLEPRDRLTVFDLSSDRERIIAPLMQELAVQGGFDRPTEQVSVTGRVKVPGLYPLEPHMRVTDLIRAGGTLDAAAYGGVAELSRYAVENGQVRRAQVIQVDLAAALRGEPQADLELQPYDGLYVKEVSGWSKQEQVTLTGEVRFPGTYPIRSGETLRSVIERAGGLTELAFASGSVFTREDLQLREQQQLDRMAERLKSDLATMSLMAARANQNGAQQTYTLGQTLLDQLKSAKAVGRLVIDLDAVLRAAPGSPADVVLRDHDTLVIPRLNQEVTVLGEVQNVTSHLYTPGYSRDQYIDLSGGLTRGADRRHIYVVRANGSVIADTSRWRSSGTPEMLPGDTVVVPLNTDRMPQLTLWQSATQILYNIAIAAAAVHSL
jgi:polysaccharide export outer membrane protein